MRDDDNARIEQHLTPKDLEAKWAREKAGSAAADPTPPTPEESEPASIGSVTACGAETKSGAPCGVVVLDPSGRCKHHHGPEMDEWWESRKRPAKAEPVQRKGGFKQRISAQADDVWGDIESTLHAAIEQATKRQFTKCPHCKKRHEIDVRDWPASLRASEMLLDRVAPKPSTAAGKQAADGDDFHDLTLERVEKMSYSEVRAYRSFSLASDADAVVRALDNLNAFDALKAEYGLNRVSELALSTRAKLDDEDLKALYERMRERYEQSEIAA